jgi:ribosomal protein L11 methyltransferase
MSRRSSRAWRWRRWIAREFEALWLARLEARGTMDWLLIEKPQRKKLCVEAFFATRADAFLVGKAWGGRVERVETNPVLPTPGPPIRLGRTLEIIHESPRGGVKDEQLAIPYGMAFGSGEHATTLMLLRALAERRDFAATSVLDLGTGSGVLALTARKLGASRITATDFDPDAVRTARQNELLNFGTALVRWECADVRRLRAGRTFSLVLANLFSGILCEASARIARAVRADGELWLSGILRTQQDEVTAAYRQSGLRLVKTTVRGKWVMQRWRRS